jgi:general secretion pathway protein J
VALGGGTLGRQKGFTLLELLVALVVLGLLVVGLTRGVRAGLTMWGAQTRRIGETGELDASARVLRVLFDGISVPPAGMVGRGAAGTMKVEGHSDSLAFVGELPTGFGTTRRANITLESVEDHRLVLRWTPHRHELTTAPEPKPVEIELIRGVAHVDFAYWGSPAADQAAGWQAQWDSFNLPELIRVRVAFAKGDRPSVARRDRGAPAMKSQPRFARLD